MKKKSTDESTEEITKQITDESTEQFTDESTEQITEETTEESVVCSRKRPSISNSEAPQSKCKK